MSEFNDFKKAMQKQFTAMIKDQDVLFKTDVDKDAMWEKYLGSFPVGTNEIFRERRELDCNACRRFIRAYGNVVTIKYGKTVSIWDMENAPYPYDIVAKRLSKMVKAAPIKNVFVSKEAKLGVDKNREINEDGKVVVWEHLYYKLPAKFVDKSSKSGESIQGTFRDAKNVFQRSMEEFTLDAANTILELIEQGSLYRGDEHRNAVAKWILFKTEYDLVAEEDRDNWCWITSYKNPVAKIKNSSIGTLLEDLSKDVELDQAVRKFEKVMAPANYKRPKAIFTKKMIEQAEKQIIDMGFQNSLARKFATLEDITVNNVLFVDREARGKMAGSVFDDLKAEVAENPKSFSKVEEVSAEDFVTKILPTAHSLSIMPENKHSRNLMSLIAPQDRDAPSMLKWGNNFSWSYTGDVADSMKENVKNAGGKVDGVLRFSIQWNGKGDTNKDYDAHCKTPHGSHIFFGQKRGHPCGGNLDVDIVSPQRRVAVENITWPELRMMADGRYTFWVHNYSGSAGASGFTAELEFEGQIHTFEYPKGLRGNENVEVATVDITKDGTFKIVKSLDSTTASKTIWGVNTNTFTKVATMMYSPNYWDGQEGKGPKHYFFFPEGCKADDLPRGFYNEHLNNDLLEHKRVFEALGSKMRVAPSENQLSGFGFSSTQRNELLVKVEGSVSRVLKIKF